MRRLSVLVALAALAQQPPGEPTLRVSVDLVQVDATVTGRDGKLIRGLGVEDFELLQDGTRQKIDSVSLIELAQTPVAVGPGPLKPEHVKRSITVVVDDLNLSHLSMASARDGLRKFVLLGLPPGTAMCILRTGGGAGNLQTFTADQRQLLAIIDSMKWNPGATAGLLDPVSSFRAGLATKTEAELTELAVDVHALGSAAAIEWAFRGVRTMPGRKSMILITDGIPLKIITPYGVKTTRAFPRFQRLAAEAHRAGVVFYTIHPGGVGERSLANIGEEDALGYMPAQTGGRFLRERNFLERDMTEISEEQSAYYLISYKPPPGTFDGKYHKVEVRPRRRGLTVRARRELLGEEPRAEPAEPAPRQRLAQALLSPFHAAAIPLRLTALHMVDGSGNAVVRCLLHIDAKPVRLQEAESGAMHAELDVLAAGVDAEGRLTAINENRFRADVPEARKAELERHGFLYGVEYSVAKPGPYQIRVAVRDPLTGLVGSASQFVEIPDRSRRRMALSGVVLDRKKAGAAQVTEADPMGNPAVRRFRPGDDVMYAMQLYNAPTGKTQRAALTSQVCLYRDGKIVFEGRREPLVIGDGVTTSIVPLGGTFHLGSRMPPGNYVAELRVSGLSQWIDFTVE